MPPRSVTYRWRSFNAACRSSFFSQRQAEKAAAAAAERERAAALAARREALRLQAEQRRIEAEAKQHAEADEAWQAQVRARKTIARQTGEERLWITKSSPRRTLSTLSPLSTASTDAATAVE